MINGRGMLRQEARQLKGRRGLLEGGKEGGCRGEERHESKHRASEEGAWSQEEGKTLSRKKLGIILGRRWCKQRGRVKRVGKKRQRQGTEGKEVFPSSAGQMERVFLRLALSSSVPQRLLEDEEAAGQETEKVTSSSSSSFLCLLLCRDFRSKCVFVMGKKSQKALPKIIISIASSGWSCSYTNLLYSYTSLTFHHYTLKLVGLEK